MTYEQFKEYIKENIMLYLPESFQKGDIGILPMNKNNSAPVDGLYVRLPGAQSAPLVYLNTMYKQYQDGEPLDTILHLSATTVMENVNTAIDTTTFMQWNAVCHKIIPQLINYEANTDYLADKVFKKELDLAIVYRIIADDDNNAELSTVVTKSLLDVYQITEDELHDAAINNLHTQYTYRVSGISDLFKGEDEINGEDPEMQEMYDMMKDDYSKVELYILYSPDITYGAALILNDEIRQELYNKFGDYYILPSSIYELLILPKSDEVKLEDLARIVPDVNENELKPEDRLSDHVYGYDAENHKLIQYN